MSKSTQDRLHEIDKRWCLHEHRDPSVGVQGKCLAFVVDDRHAVLPGHSSELRFRLGASYGHNPFTPAMACGFMPPPVQPGKYIFGIHLLGTNGNQVTIYDEWYDSREVSAEVDALNAADYALEILSAIPDQAYLSDIGEGPGDGLILQRSELIELDSLEILDAEAF